MYRPTFRRSRLLKALGSAAVAAVIAAVLPLTAGSGASAADPCGAGSNQIVCENSKPGTPMTDWYAPSAYGNVQGFTTAVSVQAGDTVSFKVQSPVPYHVEVYRLGYYGGDGARLMSTSTQTAQTYPANFTKDGTPGSPLDTTVTDGVADGRPLTCTTNSAGLQDCGNWPVTATWTVPAGAVSGLYLANFDQADGNGLMPYPFVVRNDASRSDIVVQTDDETWQAYNKWGGRNLYDGNGPAPDGRAYQVSYNRPLDIGGDNGIYGSEYEMLYWLEHNGYDVSYISGVDMSTNGSLLVNHKMFMSSGHDEYWTQAQFSNALAARRAGVAQAYFSGNEVSWKTRFGPSIDGSATANRTLICYKETKLELPVPDGVPDPDPTVWTGAFLDPGSAAKGEPFQPQNILTGSLFTVNGYRSDAITVPAAYAKMRLWRGTSVADLAPGQTATFPVGTLGYEWDSDLATSTRPAGQIDLSSTTVDISDGKLRQDYGNVYGDGTATHNLVEFRDQSSGALVFGAGTVQWSWGLSNVPAANPADQVVTADPRMQQATVNLFADMGVQPGTLQSGLTAATATSDRTGPAVSVAAPTAGATVPALRPVTVSGTAADSGGVVARVEVSTDGGTTWNAATGTTSWTYSWTPTQQGSAQLMVRAVDDSVNIGAAAPVPLTVGPQQCPCTVWPATAVPHTVNSGDGSAVELGVKFRTSAPGSIIGVRFYKAPGNTGTHTGSLWTAAGQRLATATFTGESASGWQQVNFSSPIPVKSGVTYVASYFAPNGGYSFDGGYFSSSSAGLAPLTALASGTDGGNGVYHYGASGGFPGTASAGSNYWVDPVLDTSAASTQPPEVSATSPRSGATGVPVTAPVSATFTEPLDTSTVAMSVTDAAGAAVPGTISLSASDTVTFTPSTQLALGTSYTASVQGDDLWGNHMAQAASWTFTTSPTPPALACPCTLWPGAAQPAVPDTTGDANALELGTRFTPAVSGWVTGVQFYKGPGNTGTHTGSLWAADGTLLATGTFTGESATGWQTMTFASPVAVTAGTSYVVSYHAPNGNYAVDGGYFTSAHQAYPLTAPADGAAAANGLYHYGAASAFPTSSYGSANYWVGPVFTAGSTAGATSGTTTETTRQ